MALASFGTSRKGFRNIKFFGIEEILNSFGEKLVFDLGKSLENSKDATGELRNSIDFRTKIFNQVYTFELLMLDYYRWVDEGRKPGKWPNITAIKKWISEKNTFNEVKTKKGLKTLANSISGVNQLAFLIGRKIHKDGIKPYPFYSRVIKDGRIKRLSNDLTSKVGKEIVLEIKDFTKRNV